MRKLEDTMRPIATSFVLLALQTGPAWSQSAADCSQSSRPAQQVKACTEVLGEASESQVRALAYMNRAIGYARQKKFKEALVDLNASIEIDSNNPLSFYNRGNVQFDLGRLAPASEDFGRAIELDPAFALAYLNRGLCHERQGRLTNALADFKAALAADPALKAASAGVGRVQPITPASEASPLRATPRGR